MNSYLEKDFELLKNADSELFEAFEKEQVRQSRNIELIASENLVSPAVMAAMGSVLTNKYAEGYPSKRYYGGCYCVDVVEEIAREERLAYFREWRANNKDKVKKGGNLNGSYCWS